MRTAGLIAVSSLVLFCGCQPAYRNAPLESYDPNAGYRFDALKTSEHNSDSLFVCVTCSGGGTRAAAFAYGVLKALHEIPIPGRPSARLMDEVDIMTGVSGGSFTAMGYGLWREDLFNGHYENNFLRHNIQGDLIRMNFNPMNIGTESIMLAADFYNKQVFKEQTYADLIKRGTRPFIVVSATDITRKKQFRFIQEDFDMLGSDLAKLPVAQATAASSAYPVLLDPLRLKYYPGASMEGAIYQVLNSPSDSTIPGRYAWAHGLIDPVQYETTRKIDIDEEGHKYMYVLDGGLVDNLGLTYLLESDAIGEIGKLEDAGLVDRFVLIVIDAGTAPPKRIEAQGKAPGKLAAVATAATSGIYTTTWMLTGVAAYMMEESEPEIRKAYNLCSETMAKECPGASPPQMPASFQMEDFFININFRQIKERQEREKFLSMPTTFALNKQQIDDLIEVGQRLVWEHPKLEALMESLRQQ